MLGRDFWVLKRLDQLLWMMTIRILYVRDSSFSCAGVRAEGCGGMREGEGYVVGAVIV
jgi:hypothetical protein